MNISDFILSMGFWVVLRFCYSGTEMILTVLFRSHIHLKEFLLNINLRMELLGIDRLCQTNVYVINVSIMCVLCIMYCSSIYLHITQWLYSSYSHLAAYKECCSFTSLDFCYSNRCQMIIQS